MDFLCCCGGVWLSSRKAAYRNQARSILLTDGEIASSVSTPCASTLLAMMCYFNFFSIFAHVSFNGTVRLKTGLSSVESISVQKYPWRSNWKDRKSTRLNSSHSQISYAVF